MLKVFRFKEIKLFFILSVKKGFWRVTAKKSNHKNMMKSNGGIPSYHESENEGTCFF